MSSRSFFATWVLCSIALFSSFFQTSLFAKNITWKINKVPELKKVQPIEGFYSKIYDIFTQDFDDDGVQEIGFIKKDYSHNYFLGARDIKEDAYTLKGRAIDVHEFDRWLMKLSGHHIFKWLTYRIQKNNGIIDLYDKKFNLLDSIRTIRGFDRSNDGKWSGYLTEHIITDVNNDMRQDLVVSFNTGWDEAPRAILAYDLLTKKELFSLRFAPMVQANEFSDLNQDGNKELIVSLAGASNGDFFGDFSRDSSYLVIYDQHRKILKRWNYAGESTYVFFSIADMNKDRYPDIITLSFSRVENPQISTYLEIIDGKTLQKICRSDISTYFTSAELLSVNSFDGSGSKKILVASPFQGAALFKFDMKKSTLALASRAIYNGQMTYQTTYDINQDGKKELFFQISDPPGIAISNCDLELLSWFSVPTYTADDMKMNFMKDLNDRDELSALFLDNGHLFSTQLDREKIFPPPALRLNVLGLKLRANRTGFLAGVLFFIFLVSLLIFYLIRNNESLIIPESSRTGWLMLDKSGFVKNYNYAFFNLSNILPSELKHSLTDYKGKNVFLNQIRQIYLKFIADEANYLRDQTPLMIHNNQKNFDVELFRLKTGKKHSPTLITVAELTTANKSDEIRLWASMAQRIAHKIKTPLATILLVIQRLQRNYHKDFAPNEKYDDLFYTAISEIERVRENINIFMKVAQLDEPNLQKVELTEYLKDELENYKSKLPEGVELVMNFKKQPIYTKIDKQHFHEVLYNLFDNSITAMDAHGQIELLVNSEISNGNMNHAIIEINDNGKGMSKEEIKNIFTPGFTTSAHGSGLGLVIAKNIIQSHNGTINVHSAENSGTTIEIRLPMIEENGY